MDRIGAPTQILTQQPSAALVRSRELDDQGQHERAIELLRRCADDGELAAMSELALRLLVGRNAPFDPQEGLALLQAAASSGNADALTQLATLKAAGAWVPQNWDDALDLVQHGAQQGSERARGQLLILAADRALAEAVKLGLHDDVNKWQRLRQSVSLKDWFAAPARCVACEAPRIRIADHFVPREFCDWLIERSRGKFKPSVMFDGQKSSFLATRTCSDFKFDITDADLVLLVVRERIAAITTLPTVAFEPPQIFHYDLGEEIKPHYDALRVGDQGYGRDGGYKGDRVATFLLYLNDDYDGGELEFPKVGFRYKGRKGDGVYFAHVLQDGRRDPLSLHAGLPVTRSEKFILSQWIHDRPFTAAP